MKWETYKCDECGAVKQEANHWFRAWRSGTGGVMVRRWEYSSDENFDNSHKKPLHLCGAGCVSRTVTKILAETVVEKPGDFTVEDLVRKSRKG